MFKYLNIKNNQKGFSIIEMLVASLVFSIMVIIVSTNFVGVLDLQRRGFAAKVMQEEILFSVESMAREIRVSQIQGPDDTNCNLTSLTIDHPINGLTTYFVSNGVISKAVGGNTFPITSSNVNFLKLNFCVTGTGIDDEQPRVTIVASVQAVNGPSDFKFDMQTTISSRDLREEFLN